MSDEFSETPTHPASRLVAYVTIIVGVSWLGVCLALAIAFAYEYVPKNTSLFGMRFNDMATLLGHSLFRFLPMTVPGVIAAYLGNRLRVQVSAATLRRASASLAFMAVLSVGVLTLIPIPFRVMRVARSADDIKFYFAVGSIALPLFVVLCLAVLRHDGVAYNGLRDVLTRPLLAIAAWLTAWYASNAVDPFVGSYVMKSNPTISAVLLALSASFGFGMYMALVYCVDRYWSCSGEISPEEVPNAPATVWTARTAVAVGLALAVFAIGFPATWLVLEPYFAGTRWDDAFSERSLTLAVLSPAFLTPAVYCLFHGWHLLHRPTPDAIRHASAGIPIAAASVAAAALVLGPFYGHGFFQAVYASILGIATVSLAAYAFLCHRVFARTAGPRYEVSDVLTKQTLLLASILVFCWLNLGIFQIIVKFMDAVDIFVEVASVLTAWLFFRWAVRWIGHPVPGYRNRAHDV
jgi:hypothetical protein